jgi:hypothetical protein
MKKIALHCAIMLYAWNITHTMDNVPHTINNMLSLMPSDTQKAALTESKLKQEHALTGSNTAQTQKTPTILSFLLLKPKVSMPRFFDILKGSTTIPGSYCANRLLENPRFAKHLCTLENSIVAMELDDKEKYAQFSNNSLYITAPTGKTCVGIWMANSGKIAHNKGYVTWRANGTKLERRTCTSPLYWNAHSHTTLSAQFSPQDTHIITAGSNASIASWDRITGELSNNISLAFLGDGSIEASQIAISPDQSLIGALAVHNAPGKATAKHLLVFNTKTNHFVAGFSESSFQDELIKKKHKQNTLPYQFKKISFSPDGTKILTTDKYNRIVVLQSLINTNSLTPDAQILIWLLDHYTTFQASTSFKAIAEAEMIDIAKIQSAFLSLSPQLQQLIVDTYGIPDAPQCTANSAAQPTARFFDHEDDIFYYSPDYEPLKQLLKPNSPLIKKLFPTHQAQSDTKQAVDAKEKK